MLTAGPARRLAGGAARPRHLTRCRHLPQVSVRIAEITEVAAPLGGCRSLDDLAARRGRIVHDLVYLIARRDDEVERDPRNPEPSADTPASCAAASRS